MGLYPANLVGYLYNKMSSKIVLGGIVSRLSYGYYLDMTLVLKGNGEYCLMWIEHGSIHAGIDGSVIKDRGAHSPVFTNGVQKSMIWGSSAITPGNKT